MIALVQRCTCAVFDCDGVLLDSNPVKIDAFRVALADQDRRSVEAFIDEHRRSGGVSRFAKFERFFRELQPADDPESAIGEALERFAAACRTGLRTCPEIRGVGDLLVRLHARGIPLHVVSGGEQAEVREALLAREWGRVFAGIHGSPTTKRDHLKCLVRGPLPKRGVYFGDAELDMQLAVEFGFEFVFVAGASDWTEGRAIAERAGHRVIEDFRTCT